MIWSALQKYLHSSVHQHARAVEIPHLGVIGPYIEKWATMRDPLDKGPITKLTYSVRDTGGFPRTVILALRQDFVVSSELSLEQRNDKAVACYENRDELSELFVQIADVKT